MNPEKLLAHADFIHDLARSLVRDEHQAFDIAQATWLAMLKHPPAEGKPIRSWLARVIRNFTISAFRQEQRRARREQAAAVHEAQPSTQEIVEKMEIRRLLIDAVLELNEPYRSTLILRFYEGLRPAAIADRYNISVETVRTREKRGLKQLKAQLDALHNGSRRQWCLALAPLAGIRLAALTAPASVASLTTLPGVIAMTTKTKVLFLFMTLLFITGTAYILWPLEPAEHTGEKTVETLPLQAEGEAIAVAASADPIDEQRMLVEPLSTNSTDLPASWMDAMGGLKGRAVLVDGTPVPNERVQAIGLQTLDLLQGMTAFTETAPNDLNLEIVTTTTAKDGTFLLSGIDGHLYYLLRIAPKGKPIVTRFIDTQPGPGETIDLGDIVLANGASIFGKVVDEIGDPVPGVRVRATQLPPLVLQQGLQDLRSGGSLMVEWGIFTTQWFVADVPPTAFRLLNLLPIPTTATQKDGTFRLEGITPGSQTVVLDRPGFTTQWQDPVALQQGGSHDLGTVTLNNAIRGKGYVVDADKRPVAEVEVRVGARYGKSALCILQPPVFTDEQGRFPFCSHSNTTAYCAMRRHPGDSWVVQGPFHAQSDDPVLALPPAFDLHVKVFKEKGVPSKKAGLKVRTKDYFNFVPSSSHQTLVDRVKTVSAGVFEVSDLVPGEYELMAQAPGYGTVVRKVEIMDGPHTETVLLKQGHALSVTVVEAAGKTHMEHTEVFVKPRSNAWFEDTLEIARSCTDAEGAAAFSDLAPGAYTVYAYHPGYATASKEIDIPKESAALLELKSGGALEGKVHYPKGILDPPFTLFLEWEDHEGFPVSSFPRCAHTDADGRFRVEHLQPGEWSLYVVERLFDKNLLGIFQTAQKEPLAEGEVVIEQGKTARVDVALSAASCETFTQVSGRVLIDGAPATGVWAKLRGDASESACAVNASGEYLFEQVPSGEYYLQMMIPAGRDNERDFTLSRTIEVFEGQPLIEDFITRTGAVFGRVETEAGGIPAGNIRVILTSDFEKTGDLNAPSDSQADENLPSRSSNQIDLSNYFNAAIVWNDSATSHQPIRMECLAGPDGRFSFSRVPVGFYLVTATYKDTEAELDFWDFFNPKAPPSSQTEKVGVTAGGSTGPVVLTICTPVSIKGEVRLPEHLSGRGTPLPLFLIVESKIRTSDQRHAKIHLGGNSFDLSNGRWIPVQKETGSFVINEILPGRYTVKLIVVEDMLKGGAQKPVFNPVDFEVSSTGTEHLVLSPEVETASED